VNGPVLVTGAGGFAGGHLVELLAADHDVVAWARAEPAPHLARLGRWQQVDLLNREETRAAIGKLRPSAVYHCAGFPHTGVRWSGVTTPLALNVLLTHRLFDALRRAGIGCRVVVPGSATVYAPSVDAHAEDDPLEAASPYALSKLAQEQLCVRAAREDGLEVILTRSFNHTGPRQTPAFAAPSMARQIALIERGAAEPVLRVGSLEARRDLTDVRDVVAAYAALMRLGTPGVIYNVASGIGRPIRSVLDGLCARARVPVTVTLDPDRLKGHDIPVVVGDPTRLKQATGWAASISFDQMLDDLLAYWRNLPTIPA
jgi:GDP-4-dehydro-6-deoxy-D-mannose reductase